MSAGVSNSSGSDWSKGSSAGSRKGTTSQHQTQQTQYDNNSTSQTNVPAWARGLNKEIATGRAADEHGARDFLSALLTDPYDDSQPQNRFGTAINRLFDTQMARARGGTSQNGVAKQGFREGAALSGAQDAAIQQGTGAANSLLVNANPLAALDWERLVAPTQRSDKGTANTVGQTLGHSSEVTGGQTTEHGGMSGSNSGYGITLCCFIFLEHYRDKKMPWFVRRCRDEFASGPRVEGYRRMAKHLVPWMRSSKLVAGLVWLLMVGPLTLFGGWLYDAPEKRYKVGWLLAPVVMFWFALWSVMGRKINFEPGE